MKKLALIAASSVLAFAACAESGSEPTSGVEIAVSPLTFDAITDGCWTLSVFNNEGGTVWTDSDICSTDYGDGAGSISFVTTCDATDNDNTVEIILQDLFEGGAWDDSGTCSDNSAACTAADLSACADPDTATCSGAATALSDVSDYYNPCDGPGDCQLDFFCQENEDVRVEFNITIMRNARQGFFDVAVNFEDIFCAAKIDCTYDDPADTWINLLFGAPAAITDPNGRGPTMVIGFACTSGFDVDTPPDTYLYMDDITVSCDNGGGTADTFVLETAPTSLGNQGAVGPNSEVYEYSVFQGIEQLTGFNKAFWNVAIGFNTTLIGAETCTVSFNATASDVEFDDTAFTVAASGTPKDTLSNAFHPFLSPSVSVINGAHCGQNTVANAGIDTDYSTPTNIICFDNWADTLGGTFTAHPGVCGTLPP